MYQALYRKYRPKTFNEVLGQEHITRTLRQQVLKGNIGHAYLFSGTRGTGKTSAAKILSRAVNCLNPQDGNPCNECEICRGILDESIMDVIEMDAASNNSVDDVRDLKEKVIYPPSRARYKVYIIDEVHMLSKGAFNALLKTLEEPPKHLIFILATTEPERLPQTILSRCQRFDFKRITNRDIVENMRSITKELEINIDDKALNLIARNSDGAMRDALSLLDQCISFNNEVISYEDATNILGIANKYLIFEMVKDINEKNLEKALFKVDEIIQNGKDINQFIKDLIRHFRDLMVAKTSRNPAEIMESEDVEEYIEQSNGVSLEYILNSLDILNNAEAKGKWSTQPRIILEMAVIKLVSLEKELTLEERIERLEQGIRPAATITTKETKVVSEVAKPAVKEKQVIEKQASEEKPIEKIEVVDDGSVLTLDMIKSQWQNVLQNIKNKKINIYALIMEGELTSYENNLLSVVYDDGFGFHKEAVSSPQNKEFVEGIVSKYFNKNINIHFHMKSELSSILGSKKESEVKYEEKSEEIKDVIDFFGEDIVEIRKEGE
ncbi:DNA polymerase III subunit gamma/tau [Tissierella sp. Yu-01]|uniref:DNA polymerase III subunit gamma/tau n=1 Tax=Tissierella sp. Yu-01 TaxID=3035694 RepID=UPI00240E1EBC|nr:DNA polymerase III subunit gamma/tau [Tissierella sp. Yu-01]WFA08406.1 DNA polymerase III subunit gamma/tau [Tissierella sp. Yu-01]